jgi:hypothetical protein
MFMAMPVEDAMNPANPDGENFRLWYFGERTLEANTTHLLDGAYAARGIDLSKEPSGDNGEFITENLPEGVYWAFGQVYDPDPSNPIEPVPIIIGRFVVDDSKPEMVITKAANKAPVVGEEPNLGRTDTYTFVYSDSDETVTVEGYVESRGHELCELFGITSRLYVNPDGSLAVYDHSFIQYWFNDLGVNYICEPDGKFSFTAPIFKSKNEDYTLRYNYAVDAASADYIVISSGGINLAADLYTIGRARTQYVHLEYLREEELAAVTNQIAALNRERILISKKLSRLIL